MVKKGFEMNYNKKFNKNKDYKDIKEENNIKDHNVVDEPKEKSMIVKTKCLLNVRRKPSKDSDILTKLEKETDIVATEVFSNPEWYLVVTANGIEGYVMKEFVSVVD